MSGASKRSNGSLHFSLFFREMCHNIWISRPEMNLTAAFQVISQSKDSNWGGKKQADGLWALQHITFFLLLVCQEVSQDCMFSFPGLWGFCTLSTQCTNMQPAERGFRGDLFSPCAGLSYIHGNQPVQSQRPVGKESIKVRNRARYESAVEMPERLSEEGRSNHSKTLRELRIKGTPSFGTSFDLRNY